MLFIYLLLAILAYSSNYFEIELFYGLNFLFGSIFALITSRLYGFFPGIFVGFSFGLYSLIHYGHAYLLIIFTVEMVFVGYFLHYKKRKNIVFLDGLYWLIVGVPLVTLFYKQMGIELSVIQFVLLKLTINGILNALIANILLDLLVIIRKQIKSVNHHTTSLKMTLFNLFAAGVMIPSLVFTSMAGREEMRSIELTIRKEIEQKSSDITKDLFFWQKQHVNLVQDLAHSFEVGDSSKQLLEKMITLKRVNNYIDQFYMLDRSGNPIISYPDFEIKENQNILDTNKQYFLEALKKEEMVKSNVFLDEKDKKTPTLTINVPVISQSQQVVGVMTAVLDLKDLSVFLNKEVDPSYTNITVLDANDRVITTTRSDLKVMGNFERDGNGIKKKITKELYQWFPINSKVRFLEQWGQSIYVQEAKIYRLDWRILTESSTIPYLPFLNRVYINYLSLMFFFSLIALFVSRFFSLIILMPITKLTEITKIPPDRLFTDEKVKLPTTAMTEINQLMDNFKRMNDQLRQMFQDARETHEKLEHMAHHDPLTGLPNRILFRKLLTKATLDAELNHRLVGVMFVDLDRFKVINDTLGHAVGDLLVIEVAVRLRKVEKNLIISRQGGDEFIIVLPDIMNRHEAKEMAQKIVHLFSQPFKVEDHELYITASIGISLYPEDSKETDELIKNADAAMYLAKQKGKNNYQFYAAHIGGISFERFSLENHLRKAIQREEFVLHYQPKIETSTKEIKGVEALIRWNHPKLGMIPPIKFIELAEETGLIIPMGEWIIREACTQIKKWSDQRISMHLCINISGKQLQQRGFFETLKEIIEETGCDPQWFGIEITENILITYKEETIEVLQQIKNLGIEIYIDDFGTGYSSLNYLKRFPVDAIKIDRSFIKDMIHEKDDAAIVRTIVELAHTLDLKVVAEGVETKEQFETLQMVQCDYIQGYYFSPPLPLVEVEKKIREEMLIGKGSGD